MKNVFLDKESDGACFISFKGELNFSKTLFDGQIVQRSAFIVQTGVQPNCSAKKVSGVDCNREPCRFALESQTGAPHKFLAIYEIVSPILLFLATQRSIDNSKGENKILFKKYNRTHALPCLRRPSFPALPRRPALPHRTISNHVNMHVFTLSL